MKKSEVLRQLRKILITLYSTEASARLIAEDAGLIIASITFDGTIENCWQEILKEADKHNKIREIIQLATEEYRVRESELERIWREYDNATKKMVPGSTHVSDFTQTSSLDSSTIRVSPTKPKRLSRIRVTFSFAVTIGILLLVMLLLPNPLLKVSELRARLEEILRFPAVTPLSTPTYTPTVTPTYADNRLLISTPATPTPHEQLPSYVVTAYYVPSGWMLNGESPANFVFDSHHIGNCYTNIECYKISWKPEHAKWVGLYWLHPNADGSGGGWPLPGQPGCDFSGATAVTFWARGERGNEVVKFESAFYANQQVELEPTTLTQDWVKYTINISTADLTNVVGAFAWVIPNENSASQIIFYLDDIRYQGVDASTVTCIQPDTVPLESSPAQYGYNFESGTQNWTTSEGSFKPITLTTTTQVVYSGVQALQLNPNLRGGDADIYQHTEAVAYFNNTIPEGFTSPGPYNLAGKLTSCYVFLPSELAPGGNTQAYIRLFVKDKDFRNQFSNTLDISSSNVNRWLQLALTVGAGGNQDSGFKSTEVNALGIRVELHNGATLIYTGPLYIDHCFVSQP